jgi:hypothetical protein
MATQEIRPASIDANLAPDAFHLWAHHYYQAKQSFSLPEGAGFSPVPYFLLCRAIELELKSRYLPTVTQSEVKGRFSHRVIDAYNKLPPAHRILHAEEASVLATVSPKYADKDFEYFDPQDALGGYKSYPTLDKLDAIALKLIQAHPRRCFLGYCKKGRGRRLQAKT